MMCLGQYPSTQVPAGFERLFQTHNYFRHFSYVQASATPQMPLTADGVWPSFAWSGRAKMLA